MVCDDVPTNETWTQRANSASVGSMNSDPLCCPLAQSHDELLCSTSPLGELGINRPDLLPGRINDLDEIKSNHSF